MSAWVAVALGGALGSVARHLAMAAVARWLGPAFPWGTLAVNVLGSFAMGAIVGLAEAAWRPSPELRAFLSVGVLGGFTTFSTFSLDAAALLERGEAGLAAAYVGASVLASVGALFAGLFMMRALAA